jgi:hypothetical protein
LSSITALRFSFTPTPGRSLGVIAAELFEPVRSRMNLFAWIKLAKVHATSKPATNNLRASRPSIEGKFSIVQVIGIVIDLRRIGSVAGEEDSGLCVSSAETFLSATHGGGDNTVRFRELQASHP